MVDQVRMEEVMEEFPASCMMWDEVRNQATDGIAKNRTDEPIANVPAAVSVVVMQEDDMVSDDVTTHAEDGTQEQVERSTCSEVKLEAEDSILPETEAIVIKLEAANELDEIKMDQICLGIKPYLWGQHWQYSKNFRQ